MSHPRAKELLRKLGLWYTVSQMRQLPDIVRWIRSGCTSSPPHAVKLHVCLAYARSFKLRIFVETGTYLGETTEWMARAGLRVFSIELDVDLQRVAEGRLKAYRNVTLLKGNSAYVLPELLESEIKLPCLFWLDAHYSGVGTARGAEDSPIMAEVEGILSHKVGSHVILIDDARLFVGRHGYPHLDELL